MLTLCARAQPWHKPVLPAMAAAVSARHRVRSVHLCATGSAGEEQVSWLLLFAAQVAQLSLIACEAHYDMVVKLGTFHCTGLYGVQALCQPFNMCYRRCMQRSCLFRHILVLFFLHTASMHKQDVCCGATASVMHHILCTSRMSLPSGCSSPQQSVSSGPVCTTACQGSYLMTSSALL